MSHVIKLFSDSVMSLFSRHKSFAKLMILVFQIRILQLKQLSRSFLWLFDLLITSIIINEQIYKLNALCIVLAVVIQIKSILFRCEI